MFGLGGSSATFGGMERMDTLSLIAVLAGVAFIVTNLACRRSIARSRQPSFLVAVRGAFCTALVMMIVFYGRELFTLDFWEDGKAPMMFLVPMFLGACTLISLIPASAVVLFYRRKLNR